ncbi:MULTISPECIES: AAA family ATPase [Actinosynnema]|uniref:AAA family ATPase n=1 Tax=Actinosynnema TaxID=40566 RepID=UPI0020A2C1C9|nr:AAA family ATPase [Actinosynnema pretiosum]MCP2099987.1 putative ATP-binding protein involved in virulence [Actinosynnema pretiosum]
MYVSKVHLHNVKGFHGSRTVNLDLQRPDGTHEGWTVLAGRNGSGKTTLLRGIALALGGPAVARSLSPDFHNWITTDAGEAVAEVEVAHGTDWDRFQTRRKRSGPFRVGLKWALPSQDALRHATRPSQPSLTSVKDHRKADSGPWQDNPTGWFCAAYGPFRRLVGGSGDAQRLMMTAGPVGRMASLFHEEVSLAEGVSWLIDQHLRSLEGKDGAELLKDSALAILADGLLPDDHHVEGVDSEGLWVRKGDHRFSLREMSDGYRTVVALVVDLLKQIYEAYGRLDAYRGEQPLGKFTANEDSDAPVRVLAPGVVIIDEVDAHLHVSWQKRIGEWLKQHFPAVQFIVTTHSPYICQAADESGLIRLPGPDEPSPPQIVTQDLWERIVYGSGDDAVLSDLFGLDTAYSPRAVKLRDELTRLEIKVLSGTADDGETRRYRKIKETLSSSPTARVHEVNTRIALQADGR